MPEHTLVQFFYRFGLVPARYSHPAWALWLGLPVDDHFPFLTSMFIHGGWLHIIANMWALWIFGDKLRNRMVLFQSESVGLRQLLTTALRTKLGATLLFGVRKPTTAHYGLLPLPVAPSQDAEMGRPKTSSFPLCPDHRPGPALLKNSFRCFKLKIHFVSC